jgi:hypothetical protein
MAFNRITRGNASVGALTVNTDLQVGDDIYVAGHMGNNIAVNNIADGGSMAITAAQLLNGIVTATPTAARGLAAPTAESLIAAVTPATATGLGFEFTVINLASATHVLTLGVATGTTIVGLDTIQPATSATFVARIASGTTVVIYRK